MAEFGIYHDVFKPYMPQTATPKRRRVTQEQSEAMEAVFRESHHPSAIQR